MALELLFVAGALHRGIAAGAGEGELHGSAEQLEALDVVDGFLGCVDGVEDDEGLALGLEVGLGYDVDDVAIFGEQLGQGLLELLDLDRLLEVAAVYATQVSRRTDVSECNDTYVAFGGGLLAGADMMGDGGWGGCRLGIGEGLGQRRESEVE